MYTKPVSDIIQRHGPSHHSYAEDTQLLLTCYDLSSFGEIIRREDKHLLLDTKYFLLIFIKNTFRIHENVNNKVTNHLSY